MDGIALVQKAAGMSSHDVVAAARKRLGEKKSGHGGTLDPQATGLLVLAFGDATRWLPYLPGDKRYRARIRFGLETESEDIWGKVLRRSETQVLEKEIREVLESLRELKEQVPPMVSALKHQGRPLYEYARQGLEIERAARPLEIFELKVLGVEGQSAEFEVHCSAGTYVRSLCAEAGRRLKVGACMEALSRTACGQFRLESAWPLEALEASKLLGAAEALSHLKERRLSEGEAKIVGQGGDLGMEGSAGAGEAWRLNSEDGRLLALAESQERAGAWSLHPKRVFVRP
jgi:tRNA pseudouridine55 synthase